MFRKFLLSHIFILGMIVFMALMSLGAAFSRVVQEKDRTYIVDLHGERWDVSQAKTLGFLPERFQHGIGRNAFTPLDDSYLKDNSENVAKNLRVIGVSDGNAANAYSVRKLWRHEVANSRIADKPIAAAY